MAQPTDPQELAKVQAQDNYNTAADAIDALLDDFPESSWDSARMDTWLVDTVKHWTVCENNLSQAGVSRKEWYKSEYRLISQVPDLSMDLVASAREEFNSLVDRALDYNLDVVPLPVRRATAKRSKALVSPGPSRLETSSADLHAVTPQAVSLTTPIPPASQTSALNPATPKRAVPTRTPHLAGSVPRLDLTAASPATAIVAASSPLVVTSKDVAAPLSSPLHTRPVVENVPRASTTAVPGKVAPRVIATVSNPALSATSSMRKTLTLSMKPKFGPPGTGSLKGSQSSQHSSSATILFQKDLTSPLHGKPKQPLQAGPSGDSTRPEALTRISAQPLVNEHRSNIMPGPNPSLPSAGTVAHSFRPREPLFLSGTDEEDEGIRGSSVEDDRAGEEVAGTDGEDADKGDRIEDEASPPPSNKPRRLRKPRVAFVFDDITGDFLDSYPTIFLSRPEIPSAQRQDPRRSTCHPSSSNPDAAYLKLAQKPQVDLKKKHRKDSKGKGKGEATASRKRSRDDESDIQIMERPVTKKLKSQNATVGNDDAVRATPAVQRRGPGLSKLPPVSLGVSGGGFGERVPQDFQAIDDGVESIGVLVVEEDFGNFVKVDGRLWNKQVAPFVGERYVKPCDRCKSRKTHCRSLLGHTVICVRCYYAKQPCTVDGVTALNPKDHYRPQGSRDINAFASALTSLNQSNEAITSSSQQFLAGLNILAHNENIRVQLARLQGCLPSTEGNVSDEGTDIGDGSDDDEVKEVEAGPSKKKSKSG
ncbi:hypothetical protein F5146DRAFT_1156390 [Armillaria mellea]|nr:hypothetical protein F5146DRAFT_1156390 [Armillaria mellea]